MTIEETMQIIASFVWLLAGVGVFIVGMNFLGDALEKGAGEGMKSLLGKITNNRLSGVGIGAGVTAIIQSSSATTVMVIGLVNAGAMTLLQAAAIVMGANIGTTVTGLLVALKNDYFNMVMYLTAFIGVMLGFAKKEKVKFIGKLCTGLGMIFIGLNVMSSDEAFGNPLMEELFIKVFQSIDFPPLLILIGALFTALIQSSSAATGVVITMVGTGVMPLDLALFIILGANIGTCVTALLASVGANVNAKRVACIHFAFNVIGSVLFAAVIWIFKEQAVGVLTAIFPGDDVMSVQMRVSVFHVIFNVVTTCLLLPFINELVKLSCLIVKDKPSKESALSLKFVDERLIATPAIAMAQSKKEIDYMMDLVRGNILRSFETLENGTTDNYDAIEDDEAKIDFINNALTKYLIKLSNVVEEHDEKLIGSYFHVLNDLERMGDHAENFYDIGAEMKEKNLQFSPVAREEVAKMRGAVVEMFDIAKEAFETLNKTNLPALTALENQVDEMKKVLTARHFERLKEGICSVELVPYYTSIVTRLERVADHIVNVGYSIVSPTGSEKVV